MKRQPGFNRISSICNVPRNALFIAALLIVLSTPSCRSQSPKDVVVGTITSANAADLAVTKPSDPSLLASSPGLPGANPPTGAAIPVAMHSPQPSLIVVGFAGGFVRSTSSVHGEVELAERLREQYGSTIHAEIFENHHGDDAYHEILRLVGISKKPLQAKKQARIVLYGHSWGASEAVTVARRLERDHIPVLLVVQVDGVQKPGENDDLIPANVAQAINFYQTDGFLHGRRTIHAADPANTKIIGNFRVTYKGKSVPCPGYPWYTRLFTRPHIEIENDPQIWNQVEALILAKATP